MRGFEDLHAPEHPPADGTMLPADGSSAPEGSGESDPRVRGERGISSVNRARPLQSRITNLLALGLMSTLGIGFLGWYYAHTFAAESQSHHAGQAALARQASGTVPLPPLGPIRPPAPPRTSSFLARTLGPPPAPPLAQSPRVFGAPMSAPGYAVSYPPAAETPSPHALALARELSGPAYDTKPTNASSASSSTPSPITGTVPGAGTSFAGGRATPAGFGEINPGIAGTSGPSGPNGQSGRNDLGSRLSALLTPTVTRAVRPSVLPTRRLLLPKGAFINCTLETAIDSTLPGMTTCITATDTFSADGTVVLLPRGTELVGETRGQVAQGSARIFVLWSEARTPGGVVIPLDSPGTDALGRSGLTGIVNRHFWERFGAAILISVIDGGIQYGVESQNQGGALVYEPGATEGVMTEALKSTVDIPPTITVPNGARIQVLVARNIDFRSVYALRPTGE